MLEESSTKRCSKSGQHVDLSLFDVEQLIQFGDREDFVDLRPNAAQLKPPAVLFHLLVKGDQLAERRALDRNSTFVNSNNRFLRFSSSTK